MCTVKPMMAPRMTIPAPVQNSHQIGPMGSAIPPMTKPAMTVPVVTQETGLP